MQHAVLDEDIFFSNCGLFEFAVAKATDFSLLGPYGGVEGIGGEIFEDDRAVFVIYNCAETVPDEEACKCEANEETCKWDNGYPFLAWIFVLEPWFLDGAFFDTARVKVWSRCDVQFCR